MAYRLGERAWFEAYDAGKQLSAETAIDLAGLAVSPAPHHDAARAAVGRGLLSSRAARGQFNLRHPQNAHNCGNSRRKRRWIGDGRLRWPLDQYRGRRVGRLD